MTTVFSHICFVKPITGYSISESGLLSNNNVGRRMFVLQFCRTANKFSISSSKTVILREMKTFIAEMLSSLKVVSSKKSTVGHRPLLESIYTHGHFIRYTFLVPGCTSFCLPKVPSL